jgi:hypothetical protein
LCFSQEKIYKNILWSGQKNTWKYCAIWQEKSIKIYDFTKKKIFFLFLWFGWQKSIYNCFLYPNHNFFLSFSKTCILKIQCRILLIYHVQSIRCTECITKQLINITQVFFTIVYSFVWHPLVDKSSESVFVKLSTLFFSKIFTTIRTFL